MSWSHAAAWRWSAARLLGCGVAGVRRCPARRRAVTGPQAAARHGTPAHGLMFPTAFGNPSDPDTFSRLFSCLAKETGLGHWHPHQLRHSGASLMLAQGTRSTSSPKSSATPASRSPRTSTDTCWRATAAPPPPALSWGNCPRWLPGRLPKTPKTPVEDQKTKGPDGLIPTQGPFSCRADEGNRTPDLLFTRDFETVHRCPPPSWTPAQSCLWSVPTPEASRLVQSGC
ncbi:tyrosine-type recombinase/integrase [Nonomuraea sp. NPDC049625]|uniref:tyrosine-type recombinase/integrase n=1 Tax=Nonomuraea sp. NPDC049625 TaxID=3155775 RepID=UPI00341EF88C